VVIITTDFLRLRRESDDQRLTGQDVEVLAEGDSYPDDAIDLTEDSDINGQYNFGSGVTDGKYLVYVEGEKIQMNSEDVYIQVIRSGVIDPIHTSFVQEWNA